MTRLLITSRTLLDGRVGLIWWAVGLFVYTAFIMAVWPVIDGNEDFQELADSYPEGIQALMGGSDAFAAFTTPAGFLNAYLFSMILPLLLVALGVTMGASLVAGEEENGLLDLLLSNPVTRSRAIAEKALAIVVALVGLGVVLNLVILAVGLIVDLTIGVDKLVAATVGTLLFGLLHALLSMLAGAVRGSKGFALGLGLGVALVGYLLNVLANMDNSLEWLRWGSSLYYATADDPLANGMPVEYVVLVGACMVTFGATLVAFRRHDLS
jgi:ABC-2 type transport system permease protein